MSGVEFKKLEKFPDYQIYKTGAVVNVVTGNNISTRLKNHTPYILLKSDSAGGCFVRLDKIMLLLFKNIRVPPKHRVVYLDGNPLNCSIENLDFAPKSHTTYQLKQSNINRVTGFVGDEQVIGFKTQKLFRDHYGLSLGVMRSVLTNKGRTVLRTENGDVIRWEVKRYGELFL